MSMQTLTDLFEDQLKDLYNAENQLTKALPRMAKRASSAQLKKAFETHLEETREHIERLDQLGEDLGLKLTGKTCKAMKGLIEEGKEVLEEDGEDALIDAALIAAAQRVEHYEISAYGTVRAMAEKLGHSKAVKVLQKTLEEEYAADDKLTDISLKEVLTAAGMGSESN